MMKVIKPVYNSAIIIGTLTNAHESHGKLTNERSTNSDYGKRDTGTNYMLKGFYFQRAKKL